MAVYRQRYKEYDGVRTLPALRFSILMRYSLREVFAKRSVLILFVLSFVPVLGFGSIIYLSHNLDALVNLGIPVQGSLPINAEFFKYLLIIQSTIGFFMAALAGPGLVSPDLTNNALPMYLSRPFSRPEYVLGKFSVLAALISLISWIPGLVLFVMHAAMEGNGWFGGNLRIGLAMIASSWVWILTVCLMALALSAWVRWKSVAGGLMFFVFFASAGFGEVFNEIMNTRWGTMFNLTEVISGIGERLFTGSVTPFNYPLPLWSAWLSLAIVWSFSLFMLWRKIRAYEVVR